MRKLLKKEMILSASPLSYLFVIFGLLAFAPGYPILVGTFFACIGIFQTFQASRESNDILYTALLPVNKGDVVRAKYSFCLLIEACYFLITATVTVIRMTALADVGPYRTNALMPANLVYLGYVLVIFGCFNAVFVGGFFKTAYRFAKPFVTFIIVGFLVIGAGETLWHIPVLALLGTRDFSCLVTQLICLGVGGVLFTLLTVCSMKKAICNFERIDL